MHKPVLGTRRSLAPETGTSLDTKKRLKREVVSGRLRVSPARLDHARLKPSKWDKDLGTATCVLIPPT